MLGKLLEFSVCARPVAEAVDAYTALGLTGVAAGEIAPQPYAVVSDDRVAIGIYETLASHEWEPGDITPTFVRPGLKDHVRALRRRGVEFEFLELADEEFHCAGFRDPTGCPVRLIEARTFPPPETNPNAVAICGRLIELSIAARSLDEPVAFWKALGLEDARAMRTPHPSFRLQGHGLALGLHETTGFRAGLTFCADNLAARVDYLRAKRFDVRRGSPLTRDDAGSATLLAPGGVQFFLVDRQACDTA